MHALFVAFIFTIISIPAYALGIEAEGWAQEFMLLFGGVSLLLYGLKKMTAAVKALSGNNLRHYMSRMTKSRLHAMSSGLIMTTMVQSSGAVIAMVISLVNSRALTLPQSIGLVLGADIGTTITVQLIAFKLSTYALYAIAIGFIMRTIFANKNENAYNLGRTFMAVGFIFFGLFIVGESAAALSPGTPLGNFISHLDSPFLAFGIGLIATTLMQSSAAMMGIILALVSGGAIGMITAIYMMLGANIGSTSTAVMVSLSKNAEARRVALVHVMTKVIMVLLMLPVLIFAEDFLLNPGLIWSPFSSIFPESRQIANAHTAFNILVALMFLPLIPFMSLRLKRFFKDKPRKELAKINYLDNALLMTPDMALDAYERELPLFATHVLESLKDCVDLALDAPDGKLRAARMAEKMSDSHYRQMLKFMSKLSREELSDKQSDEQLFLITITNHLESISDIMGDEMYSLGIKRNKREVVISGQTQKVILALADKVETALALSIKALDSKHIDAARQVRKMKSEIAEQLNNAHKHGHERLGAKARNRVQTYAVEMDIFDSLYRIYFHCRKISRAVLEFHGESVPADMQITTHGTDTLTNTWDDPTL
jgi:phosphate:Na+ symporter